MMLSLPCFYSLNMYICIVFNTTEMILIADGGSTKTMWALRDKGINVAITTTSGINPVHLDNRKIAAIIQDELPQRFFDSHLERIEYYGAGCIEPFSTVIRDVLAQSFGVNKDAVTVDSDITGAARALFGTRSGIACILGTGSNSCLYIDGKIASQVPPLGYILGDEGSGAALGRLFLNALYKGRLPRSMVSAFERWSSLSYTGVIDRVYRQPSANRFLSSISVFIKENASHCEPLQDVIRENFRLFFRNNIEAYGRRDLPIGAVGSIAWHYRDLLDETAASEGYRLTDVFRSPLLRE